MCWTSIMAHGRSCIRSIAPEYSRLEVGGRRIEHVRSAHSTTHPGTLPGWIIANAAGYAAGIALWQAVYPIVRPTLSAAPGGILLVAGFGATLGFCAGLAQAIILRQAVARAGVWVLAAALGGAVGFAIGAGVSETVNDALESRVGIPLTDGVVLLAFGAIVGACFGAARWLVLRTQGALVTRWILASAVGLMIGYPLAVGVIELLPELDQPWVGLAFGACAGAATALIEWLIARRQIRWS